METVKCAGDVLDAVGLDTASIPDGTVSGEILEDPVFWRGKAGAWRRERERGILKLQVADAQLGAAVAELRATAKRLWYGLVALGGAIMVVGTLEAWYFLSWYLK